MRRPKISKAEALALAKAECESLGWPWREPVKIMWSATLPPDIAGLWHYTVRTNADVRGDNPWFDVSPDGRHVLAGWDGQNAEWEARNGDPEDRAT